MKAALRSVVWMGMPMVALAVAASLTWSADDAAPQALSPDEFIKAMAVAGQPGAAHEQLKPLAGTWSYTCKMWLDPTQPPMESEGTIERTWILGGRFLQERMVGTGFDGKPGFESLGLIGYDNGQQKYTSTWASSFCTGTCTGVGIADDGGKSFKFTTEAFCPVLKKVVQGREELRFESEDKTIAESYMIENGQEMKLMEIVAVRKK